MGVCIDWPTHDSKKWCQTHEYHGVIMTGWWFQTFFIFHNIWDVGMSSFPWTNMFQGGSNHQPDENRMEISWDMTIETIAVGDFWNHHDHKPSPWGLNEALAIVRCECWANVPGLVGAVCRPTRLWHQFLAVHCGGFNQATVQIPSGKRLHNYRKSPFWIGKSTKNGAFSIAHCQSLPEGIYRCGEHGERSPTDEVHRNRRIS